MSELIVPLTFVRMGNSGVGVGMGVDPGKGVDEGRDEEVGVGVGLAVVELCAPKKCKLPANTKPIIISTTKKAFSSDFTASSPS